MDFADDPMEARYRTELRQWLATVLPTLDRGKDVGRASLYTSPSSRRWHQLLFEARYLGQTWPSEIGGQGLGPNYEFILNEECARANAPSLPNKVNYLGRSIAEFGSADQRAQFVRATLAGDIQWCQGFSEPSGGSDLANLRTRASLVGDSYVVRGQKLWTSNAHEADWCFLLARTEPDEVRHRGLSVLLVDMRTPGVEPRPVRTTDGSEHTSECFFDDVRVPRANVLGAPGQGWAIAMSALNYERGPAETGIISLMQRQVREIERAAAKSSDLDDANVQRALADVYVQSEVLRLSAIRQLSWRDAGNPPGAEGQVAKLLWAGAAARIGHIGLELAGTSALTDGGGDALSRYFESRHASVFGGTVQIQRNLLAQRGLGLPSSTSRR